MDTQLQDLRSALESLGGHPVFTVAAALSLGLTLQHGPAPHLPAPRPERHAVRAVRVVAAPPRAATWMDYIDFRRGSGDVLRWIGTTTTHDEPQPRHCGQ